MASVIGDYSSDFITVDEFLMIQESYSPVACAFVLPRDPEMCEMWAEQLDYSINDISIIQESYSPVAHACLPSYPEMCEMWAEQLNNNTSGDSSFEWALDGEILSTSQEVIINNHGVYTFSLSQNGCVRH